MEENKFANNVTDSIKKENFNRQRSSKSYTTFNQMLKLFNNITEEFNNSEQVESESHDIHIEPIIIYNKFNNTLKIEIKIGNTQLYKVKSLPEFYNHFVNKDIYRYGNKLEFIHTSSAFTSDSIPLLNYILKYAEIIKYANEASNGYEYYTKRLGEDSILISNTGIDELFDVLQGKTVLM